MTIKEYQQYCFENYKEKIGYPEKCKFLFGNPINVLVPIETALNKVMIVGAYPSAKFFTLKSGTEKITDVPLSDNDSPFSNEMYFDGSRVRTIPSGKELNEVILEKIGVKREDCWITDLVKVFLFKVGHINRYNIFGKYDFQENRSKFSGYAEKSMGFLEMEIEIANPFVIVLLGLEVVSCIFDISSEDAKRYLTGNIEKKIINNVERNFICLPHPGILMKPAGKNPWPQFFNDKIAPNAKKKHKYA
ncbi:MAG: hypothetical protein PHN88_15510 [Ignavibacteria bacterium]|nr:hypothetical protein [Ignavibacteria bacterium]